MASGALMLDLWSALRLAVEIVLVLSLVFLLLDRHQLRADAAAAHHEAGRHEAEEEAAKQALEDALDRQEDRPTPPEAA